MQTTLHFSFPIFESSDKPSWLADWNSTVTKIDNKLYEVSIGNCGEQVLHDLEEAIAEMNEVVGRVDTLNTQVTTLTGDVETINTQVTTLTGDLETLQSVVNGISDTITIINDAIDSLDNRVDGVESTLSTLTTTVSNLQTVVQNLVDNPYELPIASANTLGGIKVGTNLSIDANGVLSASGGGGGSDDAVKVLTENDFPSEIVIETQYGHQQGKLTLPACPYVEGEPTPQEILDYAENPVFWFNPTISNLYVGVYIEGITQQVGGFQSNQFLRPYVNTVPIYNQQTQEETRYWSVSYGVAVNVEGSVRNLTYSSQRVFMPGSTIIAQSIPAYLSAGPNSPQGFWPTEDCTIMLPDNTTVQVEKGKLYLCVYNQTTYKTDIVPVYSGGGSSSTVKAIDYILNSKEQFLMNSAYDSINKEFCYKLRQFSPTLQPREKQGLFKSGNVTNVTGVTGSVVKGTSNSLKFRINNFSKTLSELLTNNPDFDRDEFDDFMLIFYVNYGSLQVSSSNLTSLILSLSNGGANSFNVERFNYVEITDSNSQKHKVPMCFSARSEGINSGLRCSISSCISLSDLYSDNPQFYKSLDLSETLTFKFPDFEVYTNNIPGADYIIQSSSVINPSSISVLPLGFNK